MKYVAIFLTLALACAATAAPGAEPDSATKSEKAGAEKQPSANTADLQRWIAELASPNYRVRESAMQKLIVAGPQAVESVAKAAQTDDLEVAYRSISVLQTLLESSDSVAQDCADKALEALAAKKNTAVANLANDALAVYLSTRQERLVEQLKRLGAVVTVVDVDNRTLNLKLNKDWHGRNGDLEMLKQLPDLQKLSIHGVALHSAELKTIGQLAQLTELELFGTGITNEAAQELSAALPGVKINRRNGALLGIQGHPGQSPCRVDNVQDHSAAEAADIQPNDEIVSFEGRPVHSFEDFTALVAEKNGGDHVKIEIRRNDQLMVKEVTLGQWQ